jgi:23S rRNA pseudouridine2604 synthase
VKGNIISYIDFPKRIFPIGRLDKDSEGLIFLTNDGDIVNKILRAGNRHEKEYIVRVNKAIDPAFLHAMSNGVRLSDATTLPCKVQSAGRQSFRITLTQGLNRQVRRMCEALDYEVTALQRVRIMNVKLDKLALGKWRYLSQPEIDNIMESIADSDPTATASNISAPPPKPQKLLSKPSAPVLKEKTGPPAKSKSSSTEKKTTDEPRRSKSKTSYKDFRRKGRSR